MHLILCGFKMCGKSFFGSSAAQKLGRPFIDIDTMIEQDFYKKTKRELSCSDIYKELGEDNFRKKEKDLIASLSLQKSSVIATGGGSILDEESVLHLKKIGRIIYLHLDKEILKERIFHSRIPFFLDQKDPFSSFEQVFKQRDAIYKSVSDVVLFITGLKEQVVIEALCQQAV